jgi:integrase
MMANERKVSAFTHNQVLSAVLFLYREVLSIDLPWLNNIGRPQQSKRIPSVLSKDEVAGLLAQMDGINALLARLLYGTGMRLMKGMRLRVKDVDFERHAVIVREAKGNKDRVVMLSRSLAPALRLQMLLARALWEAARQAQHGGVEVPHALDITYPKVGSTWAWFWMFPSPTLSTDPRSGVERRHHLFEAPLVCHPPAASRYAHTGGSRAARALGRVHHDDRYPRVEGGGRRHDQPAGRFGVVRLKRPQASANQPPWAQAG